MKGLKLFLAACFIVPTFDGAVADTVKNSSRTSSGRAQQSTISRNPQQTTKSRNTGTPATNVVSRTATTQPKSVVSRTAQTPTTTKARTATNTNRDTSVVARSAKKPNMLARTGSAILSRLSSKSGSKSRAATDDATLAKRESIMQRNFSKCRTVFFECMDEFCANKDSQLRRCACSTRAGEFSATQKSLDKVEDNLLDFSQRLLKVNMDPADAAVINQESEGEKAYNETKDKTASKKLLDQIAKKLDTDFNSAGSNSLGALSWSLNADAAFDSVDSLAGAATTAKSGTALRNAALPICREMAAEVCSSDDISLAETSYNMAIEQDCNIVQKSYETQTQAAKNKVLESSALLDMTRLNTYQDNNSDDILACKSKMLDMLHNTSVCGDNLTKCLDMSGRYINPTTGEAFLTPELVNLSQLIMRPTATEKWSSVPANLPFVNYLTSKKKYLDSATKNCQVIADDVWDSFIDDALSQIKLAQNAKLEEVRQSCTTLLSECLVKANESLENFDSRALSTFGVHTDKTANALCENVKTSCSAVMEYNPGDFDASQITANWSDGATNIATTQTYDTIINTCRQIGRDCIVNSCKSITGNFGLCESIHGSVNRHSILTRNSCWNEVYNCVAAASDESINNIHAILPYNSNVPASLYTAMYGTEYTYNAANFYDFCRKPESGSVCGTSSSDSDPDSANCYRCRIAEQIWGHCAKQPSGADANKILMPTDPSTTTLLSWFAKNTHTQDSDESCSVSICPTGQIDITIGTDAMCIAPKDVMKCPGNQENILCRVSDKITTPYGGRQNCCPLGVKDRMQNCCENGLTTNTLVEYVGGLINEPYIHYSQNMHINANTKICFPSSVSSADMTMTLLAVQTIVQGYQYKLVLCAGTVVENSTNDDRIMCDGEYVVIDFVKASDNGAKFIYGKPVPDNCNNNICTYTYNYDANYFLNIDANPATNADTPDTNYCNAAHIGSYTDDNNNTIAAKYILQGLRQNPDNTNRIQGEWGNGETSGYFDGGKWFVDF